MQTPKKNSTLHIKNNFVGNIESWGRWDGVQKNEAVMLLLILNCLSKLLYSGGPFGIHFICFITQKYKKKNIWSILNSFNLWLNTAGQFRFTL